MIHAQHATDLTLDVDMSRNGGSSVWGLHSKCELEGGIEVIKIEAEEKTKDRKLGGAMDNKRSRGRSRKEKRGKTQPKQR